MANTNPKLKPNALDITGGAGDDTLDGTNAADHIQGLGGNDILRGHFGPDLLEGGDDNDQLFGQDDGDTLYGDAGNDILDGGNANDAMYGGTGDDQFYGAQGDLFFENSGEGTDTVFATGSLTLGSGAAIEFLQFAASVTTNVNFALTLGGNEFGQTITGKAFRQILNGGGGNDEIFGGGGLDEIFGDEGNDILHGNTDAAARLNGGNGSDTFDVNIWDIVSEAAGQGADLLLSPTGFHLDPFAEIETLEASDINATTAIRFSGNDTANIIRGNAGQNMLAGRGGSDQLFGNGGDDMLDGGTGSDTLTGGAGADIFGFSTALGAANIDQVADFTVGSDKIALTLEIFTGLAAGALPVGAFATGAAAGDADDRIIYDSATGALRFDADGNGAGAAIQFATLASGLLLSAADFVVVSGTNIPSGADAPVNQVGTNARDVLTGGSGNDNLDGSGGSDVLIGGNGNDTLTGGVPSSSGFNDTLFGEEGDDILDGGIGADRMYGGRGNDTYYVDDRSGSGELGSNVGDTLYEAAGEGTDTLNVSVEYTLLDSVEIEVINSTAGTSLVTGNSGDNSMFGMTLNGGGGNDTLTGNTANASLNGGAGNDIISGSGADGMTGGTGDDTFNVNTDNDVVFEAAGEGNDRVIAAVSYALLANAEVETLETSSAAGTGAINLIGSDTANTINGNAGQNILYGQGGNDSLFGLGGDDYLVGGTGADAMTGGLGNDTYYIDDAGDTLTELAGEGNDRVATLVSYTLAADASIETLESTNSTSTNAMDLTGNGLDNLIAGNFGVNVINGGGGNDNLGGYAGADTLNGGDGNDILNGGTGNDNMSGGIGNDKYYVEDTGDVATEAAGQGTDTLASNVSYTLNAGSEIENMEPITFNSTDALNFTGNAFANTILGNNGANTINGGAGADLLYGLGGQDFFAFTTTLGAGNVDIIGDYLSSFDRFMLDHNVFTGLTPGGLGANQFVSGSGAVDADDRIIYNPANGAVLFDVDGNGATAAVQFAIIASGLNLTSADFLVI